MTAALEGGEWSVARPGRTLPLGKTRYPLYGRLGGPQGRSGWVENLVLTGIRSWTVQPEVSHYTEWATRPIFNASTWLIAIGFRTSQSWHTEALINGPFVPHINSREPCYFAKVPDGPQIYTLDVLWLQGGGAQIHVWVKPQLHTHKECGPRFHPLLHISYTMDHLTAPLGEDVSSGCYVQWESQ